MVPELTKESIMPFGAFKGQKLANVPAWYLLKIRQEMDLFDNMKAYIDKNQKVLEAEKKRADRQMRR
jgi:isocitrate/isopropylmalate dehydrogenase